MYECAYTANCALVGYRCKVGACTKIVRTYRGIVMHCLRVHGLKAQMELFNAAKLSVETVMEKKNDETKVKRNVKPIRAAGVTARDIRSFDTTGKFSVSED